MPTRVPASLRKQSVATSAAGGEGRLAGPAPEAGLLKIVRHKVELLGGGTASQPYLHVPVRQLLAAKWGIMDPRVESRPAPDWPAESGQREIVVVCGATGRIATADDVVQHSIQIETPEWMVGDSRARRLNIGREVFHLVKNVRSREGYLVLQRDKNPDASPDLGAALMQRLIAGAIEFPITAKAGLTPAADNTRTAPAHLVDAEPEAPQFSLPLA